MSEKTLVIVESPTKAKTISKFLGKNFVVKASNGHVRDLPNKAAEIPPKYKKEKWSRLAVNIENDFEPLYIIPPSKRDNVKALQEALKSADTLLLATDEDREGESISWHLVETLKPKIPTKRLVFHEITKDAIDKAIRSPREIDKNLVRAQETRRIVDRLFGYEVSPLLWKKMARGLSAGRVQSVAIRLLVERERARIRFRAASFWGISGRFQPENKSVFEGELTHLGDRRLALGKDFDPNTGKLFDSNSVVVLDETTALDLKDKLSGKKALVQSVDEKPFTTKPAPPFVTSTLQQEGNRKLRMSAKRTMTVAQQLYENGFITYMRTDSTSLSQEAIGAARSFIEREYGKDYLPAAPRVYATKVKNAQEAHEAIRPAGEQFTSPEAVRTQLGDEAYRLYDLIWKRTVASQMADAQGTYINVGLQCEDARFRSNGKTIKFPGFLRAYVEGSDDPEADLADQERILPKLSVGEELAIAELKPAEHTTQPPARYTEGSLIKELETLGIGRPSTWATIVELVLSRDYAFKKGTALVPTFTALAVVGLLESHFTELLNYEFTANLEDDLDSISRGDKKNLEYLRAFYYGNGHPGLKALVSEGEEKIDPRIVCGISIGNNEEGTPLEVRIGKYGPFLTDGTRRTSIPEDLCPDELTIEKAEQMLTQSSQAAEALGVHPETGEKIYLKNGRYGPYIQMGENGDEAKPKMASLLKNTALSDVTLEYAIKLLSLPRSVGVDPETQEEIVIANGRFGPYVKAGKETRSIPLDRLSPLDMSREDAIALLREPKTHARARVQSTPLKEFGEHPLSKKPIVLRSGRFGPYVTDGTVNASVPRGRDPGALTLDEAVQLLRDREEKIASDPPKKKGRKVAAKATDVKPAKAKTKATKSTKTKSAKTK